MYCIYIYIYFVYHSNTCTNLQRSRIRQIRVLQIIDLILKLSRVKSSDTIGFRSESYSGECVVTHAYRETYTSVDGKIQINDTDTCCAHCLRIIFVTKSRGPRRRVERKRLSVLVVRRCYVNILIIHIILLYYVVVIRRTILV